MVRTTVIVIILLIVSFMPVFVRAEDAVSVTAKIEELQKKITELQGEEKSLSQQIRLLDSRISLTTIEIQKTKNDLEKLTTEINELETEVSKLEDQLTKRSTLVLRRIPESYKRKATPQFGLLLFSQDFMDFLLHVKYISKVEQDDAQLLFQLKATQNNFNERKDLREQKTVEQKKLKGDLEKETAALAKQKKDKQALLVETKNSEATFQVLLSQAKAQLAGFANFSSSLGGGILNNQTFCDGWGCYYNQRDSQWGYTLINGSNDCGGACSVSRVGCLITSVAMIASHMGRKDISPGDIAVSDPSNFSVGTAMLKKGTISVKGTNITRISVSGSLTQDAVANGPVIVGVYYGQFGTHFVVVKSYQDGKFIMNDPYGAGGHDISFTDFYSLGSVFSVERVSM